MDEWAVWDLPALEAESKNWRLVKGLAVVCSQSA